MADARRDNNFVTTLIGVSSVDGVTPTLVEVNPVTGAVLTESSSSGGSTQITDGTNTTNVLKSDGTAAGQNSLLTAGAYMSVSYSTTGAQMTTAIDAGNYSWVAVQITAQAGNTTTFQTSNDNINWYNISLMNSASTNGSSSTVSTTTSNVLFHGPISGRYFRLNCSGGTSSGIIMMGALPRNINGQLVSAVQSGTWDLQTRVTTTAPTVTAVTASATNVTLKAANGNRRGLIVFNDADKSLYLKMGATASTTSFTVKLLPGGYWEMPMMPVPQTIVDGIWETAPTGNALVTEIT